MYTKILCKRRIAPHEVRKALNELNELYLKRNFHVNDIGNHQWLACYKSRADDVEKAAFQIELGSKVDNSKNIWLTRYNNDNYFAEWVGIILAEYIAYKFKGSIVHDNIPVDFSGKFTSYTSYCDELAKGGLLSIDSLIASAPVEFQVKEDFDIN